MAEILLVILTAILFQVCEAIPGAKAPFIVVATVGWTSYMILRAKREPGILNAWGFRTHNLAAATGAALAVFVVAGAALIAWGAATHGLAKAVHLRPTFWLATVLYPIWGLLQQFLLNAIVARNLSARLPAVTTVLVSSLLFGALHLPDLALAGLTAVAAIVWVPMFLKWRNLWPLAVCHGWLGAITYYSVFQRDVLADLWLR